MVIPMPASGLAGPETLGPVPPEFAPQLKTIKACLAIMILAVFSQFVAGVLMGSFSICHPGLINIFNIVVGIFLLNHDEDVKPAYNFMMDTCFFGCAQHCRGGLSCLSNFVLINAVSLVTGSIFNTPTAIFYITVVCNGGTKGLGISKFNQHAYSHGPYANSESSQGQVVPADGGFSSDGASNATAYLGISTTASPLHPSAFAMLEHLTPASSGALILSAIAILLCQIAQGVCVYQGAKVLMGMASLRPNPSETLPNDDPFDPVAGRRQGGLLAAMVRAARRDDERREAGGNDRTAGRGGPEGAALQQGRPLQTFGSGGGVPHSQPQGFESFSGQGHRLGA